MALMVILNLCNKRKHVSCGIEMAMVSNNSGKEKLFTAANLDCCCLFFSSQKLNKQQLFFTDLIE
jgi:hypothetical protein